MVRIQFFLYVSCKAHFIFNFLKIYFQDDYRDFILRGVRTLAKCSGYYVVQYFDHWIENNDCLYIQMELCSDNLKNIIQQKQQFFRNKSSEPMKPIEYFISCQLFEELIECVKYLHESNMIHRDLKPENILIINPPKNNRVLKLCDFDLAKPAEMYETTTNTRGQGTSKYMAPEVYSTNHYSSKCDIYSLGQIAMDIFNYFQYVHSFYLTHIFIKIIFIHRNNNKN